MKKNDLSGFDKWLAGTDCSGLLTVILSAISESVFVLDENHRFLYVNKAMQESAGTETLLYGGILADLNYPPDVVNRLNLMVVTVFETGETIVNEVAYSDQAGLSRCMDFTLTLMKSNDGSLPLVIGVCRDISKDRQLKESYDQLQSILDTTLMQISILKAVRTADGKINDLEIKVVNKELERETGRNDLVGKFYSREYPGIRQTRIFDLIVETIETGKPNQMEYYYPYDGFDKWFSCMFVKLNDGIVATNMDISDRKRAEEGMRKNYMLLQQSEDLALLGNWDFDLLSSVFSWSDGMYRLFNLELGAEITPGIYTSYTTEEGRPAAERLVKHITEGDVDFMETIELNIAGQIKILNIKAAVIRNNEGHPVRVLGVDKDITAHRKADEKIRRMEAERQLEIFRVTLESQEEERRRISESLHNGLGQLLYAIKISMANITQQKAVDNPRDYDKAKRYTDQLLKDAIAESRSISHELMPTILEDFGLKAAINDICERLSSDIKFHCVFRQLNEKLDKYLELAAFRVVQELILNAVKHSGATDASVEVSVSVTKILIRVQDNGRGILKTAASKKGIGLASIRSKVKLLNGQVKIDSTPGQGTIVSVNIPFLSVDK